MFNFILVVAGVVAIIIVVKVIKKKKSIKGLKNSGGYKVALQIKDALIQAGFEVPYDLMSYLGGGDAGYWFTVRYGSEEIGEVGTYYPGDSLIVYKLNELREKNADAHRVYQGGYYYVIHNDNISLLAQSKQKSLEIPQFLKIVAVTMSNNQYQFHHPKWMFEHPESKKYLNVMFQ